jgi:hypothetical protein
MRIWDLIRKTIRRRGGDAAFVLALTLALIGGGTRALSGLPALATVLIPPGLLAAEANDEPQSSDVTLKVSARGPPSQFAPEVLEPVEEHGFPDWFARRADNSDVAARLTPPLLVPHHVPEIAIVIDNLGADAVETRRAIALPAAVSLSFLPYPDATPEFAREAMRTGHEILVHVPMEPDGTDNPGPNALTTSLDSNEIVRRLNWALSRVPGFSGINNHMGSRFTANRAALVPVVETLADKHVFFLDSRTTTSTVVVPVARVRCRERRAGCVPRRRASSGRGRSANRCARSARPRTGRRHRHRPPPCCDNVGARSLDKTGDRARIHSHIREHGNPPEDRARQLIKMDRRWGARGP